MYSTETIIEQLPFVLTKSDFPELGEKYEGKVRDSYVQGKKRYLITSDRLSAFDRILTSIPFKGQVLNAIALHWFRLSEPIIKNHLLDVPDPNVLLVENLTMLPIEVVVRGYLAGSAWRDYEAGRTVSGIQLPPGLRMSEKFESPILTPSTKETGAGHDRPISEKELLSEGYISQKLWEEVREKALSLFELGTRESAKQGLLLVDTKYEFGLLDGKLTLADEIHTLDCARYWMASEYEKRLQEGQAQVMLDKEVIRQWLIGQGFMGEGDPPYISDEKRVDIALHYLDSFNHITGDSLTLCPESVEERIRRSLKLGL